MNILDTTDKSKVQRPKEKSRDRDWPDIIGKEPMFEWIDKRSMNLDGRYQREASSSAKVMSIARNWDWRLVGALSVMRRSDGLNYIVDGGHRARAAFYRAEIDKLPCMVYTTSRGLDEEAASFVGIQTKRTSVTAIQKHIANVVAKDPTAVEIDNVIERYGYRVAESNSTTKNVFRGVGTVYYILRAYKVDDPHDMLTKVVEMSADIFRPNIIDAKVVRGLAYLYRYADKDVFLEKYRRPLIDAGPGLVMANIRRAEVRMDRAGPAASAVGLLAIINHRRRSGRVRLLNDDDK